VHLAVIEYFRALAYALEEKELGVDFGIYAEDVEGNPRRRAIVTAPNDIAVTDDEDELVLVIVIEGSEGVDRSVQGVLSFRVTGNLAEHEFILELRVAPSTELQCSQDYEGTNALESCREQSEKGTYT
jgi:hypothetical protein